MSATESVKVAVRVRPFNGREKDRNATCIIRMVGVKTLIINPDTNDEKEFAFDYSYWSHDGFDTLNDPEPDLDLPGGGYNAPTNRRGGSSTSKFGCEYASQQFVYQGLGRGVLNNALDGYNCCLFAYGQTGSGKSYSFVGYGTNKGIVPQVCDEIFRRKLEIEKSGTTKLQVTFSMMEIYNEKIRDLLNPDNKTNNDLKVRTTPKGTFVEGCKAKAVDSFERINHEMESGTASRTVAATQMNATSSRAHTVMTISVKQIVTEDGRTKEIASDMNLVDLAGSERAESTGATGDRLKEGAAINKSLSSLGNVISALAEQANNPKKKVFVPYRDSKLTQILQSALGGNSKTIMVAALSPADINFEETLSTLRYADRAKQIKVVVEVQENPTDKLIRQLKEENEKLKKMMEGMGGDGFDPAAFAAAQGGGGGGEESKVGVITEEEMQLAIEKAVAEVKAASAADKQAAIDAMRAEMNARHEGLVHGMISRSNYEHTLKEAITGTSADEGKKAAQIDKMKADVEATAKRRSESEGKLDMHDALRAVEEALTVLNGKVEPGKIAECVAKAKELLAPGSPVWADGLLEDAEFDDVLKNVLAAVPGLSDEHKKLAQDHGQFAFTTEQQAAKSNMYSKPALAACITQHVKAIGGDVAAAIAAAEMRFDQLLRDAEDGSVDEGVMQATLEKALKGMSSVNDNEKRAMRLQARRNAGWNTARNLNAAAEAQVRAKMQIAEALAKNTEMMSNLTMSFDDKLDISAQEADEHKTLLKSLGLGGLSKEEMKVTPSLRNLNEDPSMADALIYYLSAGATVVTTPDDDEPGESCIQLNGGGMMAKHGTIVYDRKAAAHIKYVPGSGSAFVNGTMVDGELKLKHNDRLILGNAQAFRVVDPLDPEASKPQKSLIDWDLAQKELSEAMGTAVEIKVEEEVAKKKAELDAQLRAMEDKFARENEALRTQLAKADPGAAKQQLLKQMDSRKRAIETFRAKATLHVNEFKRDLIRLEELLQRSVPLVKEANQMATQLGRCVKYEATLVTYIPESTVDDPLSPIEELLTQKVTELMVRCVLHNPRSDMKREWFWQPQVFSDRIARMRDVWQKWMLEQVMATLHVPEDPFWSAPVSQLIGSAYLYLAPVAYSSKCSQWVPVVNYRGEKQGELRVHLTPMKSDFKTELQPSATPDSILGKPHHFRLTVEQARGLMDCPNRNVRVEYTFSDEGTKRTTPTAQGKKFDPKFNEVHDFTLPSVTEKELTYLCKDAICFEVWGEIDDVEEADVAEAVAMELPPETFEFFLAHDLRVHDGAKPLCPFKDTGGSGSCHVVKPVEPKVLELVFSIAQADKHFKVCDVGRVRIGNVRDGSGKVVDGTWTALPVSKQGRASDTDPWVVQCDWAKPPAAFQSAGDGTRFTLTLQSEIQEVERLGLEEPLQLNQELLIEVSTGAATIAMSESEIKNRFRNTTVVQEIYMGQFEVSDAAVNLAMMSLRDQSDDGSKDVVAELESNVQKLQSLMVEECARQYEDLALRAAQLGLDIKQNLELWQLPSELLGMASGPQDAESLKKEVEELKRLLRAANERISYLESSAGATKAQQQIALMRKQMLENKGGANGVPQGDPKSKACIIS